MTAKHPVRRETSAVEHHFQSIEIVQIAVPLTACDQARQVDCGFVGPRSIFRV